LLPAEEMRVSGGRTVCYFRHQRGNGAVTYARALSRCRHILRTPARYVTRVCCRAARPAVGPSYTVILHYMQRQVCLREGLRGADDSAAEDASFSASIFRSRRRDKSLFARADSARRGGGYMQSADRGACDARWRCKRGEYAAVTSQRCHLSLTAYGVAACALRAASPYPPFSLS